MEYIYIYDSPIGVLTMAGTEDNLTGLWISGQKYYASTLNEDAVLKQVPVFKTTANWLDIYFSGKNPSFTPPLLPKGSAFRQAVWAELLKIPYGQTLTYGDIAKKIAEETGKATMAAQAVGGAVGHNPISVIIPCHRVVGAGGSLTGYAGGIGIKEKLLKLEKADMEKLYAPKKGTAL